MLGFEALLADASPVPDAMRGGEDLASIMYTGGTTGKPKGVMQSHLNLWSSSISRLAQFPLDEATITLHAAPLFHTAAMAKAVGVFVIGGTHTMVPTFDPAEVLETLERERVNDIMLVPTMLQAILACPDFARRNVSSLKRINYGASPINGAVLDAALAAMPNVEFSHAYGLTEASPVVSVNPPANHGPVGRASGLYRSAAAPASVCSSRSSTRTAMKSHATRSARSSCAAPTSCWDTGTSQRKRGRHCATAGCIPATAHTWTMPATCSSSIASRT
jgi:long-chain acyl-CoA synthetase